MSAKAMLRNEFPPGWWHSAQWWMNGIRHVLIDSAIALATICFMRRVKHAVQHRNNPYALSGAISYHGGYLLALFINGAWIGLILVAALGGYSTWLPLTGGMLIILSVWLVSNIIAAGTMLWVLTRSRMRQATVWKDIDFAMQYAPKYGRPPETVEEYEAVRLASKM